jgi:nicotinate-nucleotide pyrophosphorylase (carboxylating)
MRECHPPSVAVRDAVERALAEDLLPLGDLTASLLPDGAVARAAFTSRATGVLAGRLCAAETFRSLDPDVALDWRLDDGDALQPGSVIATAAGSLASILSAERTALNFLCHLSGIATMTRRFVDAAAGRITVWDTRKTLPGLRALEKAAVRAGGGRNHRGNLSEMVLIKDNHLGGMSIIEAVARAKDRWPARTIEVECDRIEQVAEAIEAGAGLVLLDNMSPEDVAGCVGLVDGRIPLEISGGVTLETIGAYALTGADLISTSVITQSAPALDIGLDLGTGG